MERAVVFFDKYQPSKITAQEVKDIYNSGVIPRLTLARALHWQRPLQTSHHSLPRQTNESQGVDRGTTAEVPVLHAGRRRKTHAAGRRQVHHPNRLQRQRIQQHQPKPDEGHGADNTGLLHGAHAHDDKCERQLSPADCVDPAEALLG